MPNQIFKLAITNADFFQLLDMICSKNDKYYVMNNAAYKRGVFNGEIVKFMDFCKPFYHNSKRHYLERKLNYKTFVTVLRQICKCNNIAYTSKIMYDKSSYDIVYYVSNM